MRGPAGNLAATLEIVKMTDTSIFTCSSAKNEARLKQWDFFFFLGRMWFPRAGRGGEVGGTGGGLLVFPNPVLWPGWSVCPHLTIPWEYRSCCKFISNLWTCDLGILLLPPCPLFSQNTAWVSAKSLLSCPALCDPMDWSPPSSSAHGILQKRILEWVARPPPGDLPDPGSLRLPVLAGGFFTTSATWDAPLEYKCVFKRE